MGGRTKKSRKGRDNAARQFLGGEELVQNAPFVLPMHLDRGLHRGSGEPHIYILFHLGRTVGTVGTRGGGGGVGSGQGRNGREQAEKRKRSVRTDSVRS